MTDPEEAWSKIIVATAPGWFVGQPAFEERRAVPWSQCAFDTTVKPKAGPRLREWTAIGLTEIACLEEMARCLEAIKEGRVPG